MRKVRVASVQLGLKPVRSFDEYADHVRDVVDAAVEERIALLVFPEYASTPLLSLERGLKPDEAVRALAVHEKAFVDLMGSFAREHDLVIAGGTHPTLDGERLLNTAFLFLPDGTVHRQHKIHLTPDEREDYRMTAGDRVQVFDTPVGHLAILVCYDIEFPELARIVADAGAEVILCPASTSDLRGHLRVHHCGHARAIENQLYVVRAQTVGRLPHVPLLRFHYGKAAVHTPSHLAFPHDALAAQGNENVEMLVLAELDLDLLEEARRSASVRPYTDRRLDLYRIEDRTK